MLVKRTGRVPYLETYQGMQDFTAHRTPETIDELWLCEHPPVFTQGLAGLAGHVLHAGDIPVIATNRGGQVTYHGPGQVMAYPLSTCSVQAISSKNMCTVLKRPSSGPWHILA
jgi:lipoyl(octanoyl) transferase